MGLNLTISFEQSSFCFFAGRVDASVSSFCFLRASVAASMTLVCQLLRTRSHIDLFPAWLRKWQNATSRCVFVGV